MALLLKDGQPTEDSWVNLDDTVETIPEGSVIVSLDRWRRDRAALVARGGRLGVRLGSHHRTGEIAADLDQFALVALEFPKFRDGRAFSTARELRERHSYTGEIRAIGHLLPDQYQFLLRTGFSTVAVPDDANLASWQHALTEIDIAYQADVTEGTPLSLLRRKIELAVNVG